MNGRSLFFDKVFTNANQEIVPYDKSPVSWRVSAYVLVKRNHQILLIKNALEKLFDIVGGGIEIGEDIETAIAREALEEAGAKIKLGKLIDAHMDWFYHRKGTFHQTLQLFYEAELVGELKKPTEEEIEWVEFVPISEIGNKYKMPVVVERVIKNWSS